MLFGFLGLPSLHSIIEAIANGFFGALASALIPGFLRHGTVATIQHLVALPDPASWPHVAQLQGDMVWLGVLLMPVTLTVGTLRYWLLGLTGQAHTVLAVGRCGWATGLLVGYRWIVEQTVAATNTLTHAILGFSSVSDGLARIIGVLFGGALLTGTGGVFGAFLVIIGVIFAAALFAVQVLLTVVLALLVVAGPPLIAVSPVPELSHLARAWAFALLATSLVPLAWTVLFATAGALSLDATSFTGGAGGLPGHVAAAFAGLITFVLAVRLPLMLLGQTRHLFVGGLGRGQEPQTAGSVSLPGAERVRAGHKRLRSVAFEGAPSLGRSVGRAAGALGAPPGGPAGTVRRVFRREAAAPVGPVYGSAGPRAWPTAEMASPRGGTRARRARDRFASAAAILRDAPAEARVAARPSRRTAKRARPPGEHMPTSMPPSASGAAATVTKAVTPPKRPITPTGPASSPPRPGSRPAAGSPGRDGGKPTARAGSSTHPGRRISETLRHSPPPPPAPEVATPPRQGAPQQARVERTPSPPPPAAPPQSSSPVEERLKPAPRRRSEP